MKLTIEGEPKEIAALILEVSERQDEAAEKAIQLEPEFLIHEAKEPKGTCPKATLTLKLLLKLTLPI